MVIVEFRVVAHPTSNKVIAVSNRGIFFMRVSRIGRLVLALH
jgi:hypothetical protein